MRYLTTTLAALGLVTLLEASGLERESIGVIALQGTEVPSVTPDSGAAAAMFDSLIVAELVAAGYRVVPPAITDSARKHVIDSLGGLYSSRTGELVAERLHAADVATLATLRQAHAADVLLATGVVVHSVPYDTDGKARWDGASDRVAHMEWGSAPVLTLVAVTTDSAGRPIQCGRGGLRALQTSGLWSGKKRAVKPEELFAAPARNVAAVRRALASLIAHAPTCGSSSGG